MDESYRLTELCYDLDAVRGLVNGDCDDLGKAY